MIEPFPDLHNVKDGKYYDPKGKLRSEVKNGSGVQTYWSCNGTKVWELELRNYERVRLSCWHDNGQLMTEEKYLNGQEDGPFVTHYPSGAKKHEGTYRRGKRVGKWAAYNKDGSIKEATDYGVGEKREGTDIEEKGKVQ